MIGEQFENSMLPGSETEDGTKKLRRMRKRDREKYMVGNIASMILCCLSGKRMKIEEMKRKREVL